MSASSPRVLHRTAVGTLAAVACFGLTACEPEPAASPPATPTSTAAVAESPSQADLVAWADKFCGLVNTLLDDQDKMAGSVQSGTVEEPAGSLARDLGNYAAMLNKAVKALAAAPGAPNADAEAAQNSYLDTYRSARAMVTRAKKRLDADPADFAAQDAAADAFNSAQDKALEAVDPVGEIESSPELLDAAASAPECGRS